MTFEEHRGPVAGKIFAWIGDGNNVAVSWIHAAVKFAFTLRLACPESLTPPQQVLDWAGAQGGAVSLVHDAAAAVEGTDCVITDTWFSMGDKDRSGPVPGGRIADEPRGREGPLHALSSRPSRGRGDRCGD
jgi:ornithine carbamoyltransferase